MGQWLWGTLDKIHCRAEPGTCQLCQEEFEKDQLYSVIKKTTSACGGSPQEPMPAEVEKLPGKKFPVCAKCCTYLYTGKKSDDDSQMEDGRRRLGAASLLAASGDKHRRRLVALERMLEQIKQSYDK